MQRAYHRLLDVLEYIPGLLIGLIAIAIGCDVALRNLGFIGLKGMLEIIEYALFALTFIGITQAMRRGAHVSAACFCSRSSCCVSSSTRPVTRIPLPRTKPSRSEGRA